MHRPTWDEYFMMIAKLTSLRSNCIKRKVGCVIVKQRRILSLGYNGTPKGTANCFEGGCSRCMHQWRDGHDKTGSNLDLCMCLHAEDNAMLFVCQNDLEGSTLYVTLMPCIGCVKKIIQCGIERVVYSEIYHPTISNVAESILEENNIKCTCLSTEASTII